MTNNNDPNIPIDTMTSTKQINIEGNINNREGIINFDQISGDVRNEINKLPNDASSNEQHSFKEILQELQDAIESDEELSEEEKGEALQAISRITGAGKESNPSQKTQNMIKRATNNIEDITNTLSNTSKLFKKSQELLPKLLQLCGLG